MLNVKSLILQGERLRGVSPRRRSGNPALIASIDSAAMGWTRIELAICRAVSAPVARLLAPFFASSLGRESAIGAPQSASVRIKASPNAVFALLDPASAQHRWVNGPERLEIIDRPSNRFRLIDERKLPDLPFELQVTGRSPLSRLEMTVTAENRRPFGAALSSSSVYNLDLLDSGDVRVTLTDRTLFIVGLPAVELAFHTLVMRLSLRMDLLRLKFEAETGRSGGAIW